jgi:hypothetical protein
MPKGRGRIRPSEVHSHIDFIDSPKRTIGTLNDQTSMMVSPIPGVSAEDLAKARRHISQRMLDVEDGKLLAAALGLRWRDVGDWPEDKLHLVDTDRE